LHQQHRFAATSTTDPAAIRNVGASVISKLHKFFRPELIGRFDEKIGFKPLSPDTQREIGQLVISEEIARFGNRL